MVPSICGVHEMERGARVLFNLVPAMCDAKEVFKSMLLEGKPTIVCFFEGTGVPPFAVPPTDRATPSPTSTQPAGGTPWATDMHAIHGRLDASEKRMDHLETKIDG